MTKKTAEVPVETEQEDTQPEQTPFLLEHDTAVSPFEEYPGRVTFPRTMTFPMHKQYIEMIQDISGDKNYMNIFIDDQGQAYATHLRNVIVALKFATIEMTYADGEKLPLSIDESPAVVLGWLGMLATEWLERKARFPRIRNRSVDLLQKAKV